MNFRATLWLLLLSAISFQLSTIGQTNRTPIARGYLTTPLNANQQAITNVSDILDENGASVLGGGSVDTNAFLARVGGRGNNNTLTNLTIKKPLVIDWDINGSPYILITNSFNGSQFYMWDAGGNGDIYMGRITESGVFIGSSGVLPFGGGENMGQENAPWKQITTRRIQFMPVATDSATAIYLDLTNRVHTITLTNNTTFHTTNRNGSAVLESYAIITASGGDRTIAVNTDWGQLVDMTSITLTNGTRAILSLICTGDSETNVISAYAPILP